MTAYFGWRRAELASWLKWVPDVEQFEMFPEVPEEILGVDRDPFQGYLDSTVSVSAKQDQQDQIIWTKLLGPQVPVSLELVR